jgi:adenine phosphoribosyltransferase
MSTKDLEAAIREVPDFPKAGILFLDILPLLKDPILLKSLTQQLANYAKEIDSVVGIEARGFILGTAMAIELSKGFVPLRKKGKLPGAVHSQAYGLEYGTDEIEVQDGVLYSGERVVLVDDVLATGGTLIAGVKLLQKCGVVIESVIVALEIGALNGRELFEKEFPNIPLHALIVK